MAAKRYPFATGLGMTGRHDVRIEAVGDIAAIADDWRRLQHAGVTCLYQTHEWCRCWLETAGAADSIEPVIVVARDGTGRSLFILPFARHRGRRLTTLRWLSDPHMTYGLGVHDRGWLERHPGLVRDHWPEILRAAGQPDVVHLTGLPTTWAGRPHPMAELFTLAGANRSYAMRLTADYETLYRAKRSGSSRRGNAKRDRKLAGAGTVSFGLPAPGDEIHAVLEGMFAHQAARLARSGVHDVFDAGARAFIHRLADETFADGSPILLPYRLRVDGALVATMLGGHFDDTYWALVASMAEGPLDALSPGDHALRRTIAACCETGLRRFDFASGSNDYKLHWSDETIDLHDIVSGHSPLGRVAAAATRQRIAAARRIKQSDTLFAGFKKARKLLRGVS